MNLVRELRFPPAYPFDLLQVLLPVSVARILRRYRSSLPTLPIQELTIAPFEHRSPPYSGSNPLLGQDAGDLCDARLGQFEVHGWLQTRVSTEFAAHAISFYLTTEHPILGLFDADLFLDDLVAQKTDFCSPLLLSAVLSFACVR